MQLCGWGKTLKTVKWGKDVLCTTDISVRVQQVEISVSCGENNTCPVPKMIKRLWCFAEEKRGGKDEEGTARGKDMAWFPSCACHLELSLLSELCCALALRSHLCMLASMQSPHFFHYHFTGTIHRL